MNFQIFKLDLEKAWFRGTRNQIANIHWIIEKAREFQKNIYYCFTDYAKDFVDHNNLWEILHEQAGFRKDRGPRDQIANISWIIEKARDFQKTIYFCFIDYSKAQIWLCGSQQTVENS